MTQVKYAGTTALTTLASFIKNGFEILDSKVYVQRATTSGVDLDSLTDQGVYYFDANNLPASAPVNAPGWLIVLPEGAIEESEVDAPAFYVYFDNSAYSWSQVYAYIYKYDSELQQEVSMLSWPGSAMQVDSISGFYVLGIPEYFSGGRILFSNGQGTQYPGSGQPGLEIGNTHHLLTDRTNWVEYTPSGLPDTDTTDDLCQIWVSNATSTDYAKVLIRTRTAGVWGFWALSYNASTGVPAAQVTGILSRSRGGTGASNAAQALVNLGAAAKDHTHDNYYSRDDDVEPTALTISTTSGFTLSNGGGSYRIIGGKVVEVTLALQITPSSTGSKVITSIPFPTIPNRKSFIGFDLTNNKLLQGNISSTGELSLNFKDSTKQTTIVHEFFVI